MPTTLPPTHKGRSILRKKGKGEDGEDKKGEGKEERG